MGETDFGFARRSPVILQGALTSYYSGCVPGVEKLHCEPKVESEKLFPCLSDDLKDFHSDFVSEAVEATSCPLRYGWMSTRQHFEPKKQSYSTNAESSEFVAKPGSLSGATLVELWVGSCSNRQMYLISVPRGMLQAQQPWE